MTEFDQLKSAYKAAVEQRASYTPSFRSVLTRTKSQQRRGFGSWTAPGALAAVSIITLFSVIPANNNTAPDLLWNEPEIYSDILLLPDVLVVQDARTASILFTRSDQLLQSDDNFSIPLN